MTTIDTDEPQSICMSAPRSRLPSGRLPAPFRSGQPAPESPVACADQRYPIESTPPICPNATPTCPDPVAIDLRVSCLTDRTPRRRDLRRSRMAMMADSEPSSTPFRRSAAPKPRFAPESPPARARRQPSSCAAAPTSWQRRWCSPRARLGYREPAGHISRRPSEKKSS